MQPKIKPPYHNNPRVEARFRATIGAVGGLASLRQASGKDLEFMGHRFRQVWESLAQRAQIAQSARVAQQLSGGGARAIEDGGKVLRLAQRVGRGT